MTMEIGPFTFYRLHNGTLDVSLTMCAHQSWGWEYGYEPNPSVRQPILSIRFRKLVLFYFERLGKGFELWFMGFWWIR